MILGKPSTKLLILILTWNQIRLSPVTVWCEIQIFFHSLFRWAILTGSCEPLVFIPPMNISQGHIVLPLSIHLFIQSSTHRVHALSPYNSHNFQTRTFLFLHNIFVQHVHISFRFHFCDKVCQWLVTGLRFSPGTPVSSSNKIDHHNITEILLKVALNTINQPNHPFLWHIVHFIRILIFLNILLKIVHFRQILHICK